MSPTRLLAAASLAVVWASVFAQASTPRPNPLDPNAPTTNLTVPRTFDEYLPYKEPKVAPWRETNAAVSSASGVPSGGADDGAGADVKHDMGKMKAHEAAHPAQTEPAAGLLPEGKSLPAPAGNTGHSSHKM